MDYKEYYKEIKDKLIEFSEVVYYEPMSEDEILELESEIGASIKPLYREYLLAFGMIQDAFEKLTFDIDSFVENADFINGSLSGFIPVFSEIDEEDAIYLINNKDLQDDFVYKVKIDFDGKIGQIKKLKPFQKIIDESISKLRKNYKNRSLNKDKVIVVEFIILGDDFADFVDAFETEGLIQKTDWKPKFEPENFFGSEVSVFNMFNNDIIIERDDSCSEYKFELVEPILTDTEKSIIVKAEKILNAHKIEFGKNECKLIGIE